MELFNQDTAFFRDLRKIVAECRQRAYFAVNVGQVAMNWLLGKRIVEQEQNGSERAEYGKHVIRFASEMLTSEFGRGFSESNIRSFRKFFLEYKDLAIQQTESAISYDTNQQTVPALLPWSHYEKLMRIADLNARAWYEAEAKREMWSLRTLERNISTQYYERMLLSQVKDEVRGEMKVKTAEYDSNRLAFIKNQTMLEFLGLPSDNKFTETELESAILNNIEGFLMEMGRGFALVARQRLIRTEARDYYIDVVFYNYITKCFFLVDLKIGRITHQDVGQMDMYVRMYDELIKQNDDNPTIGIVLCDKTDSALAKYSILKGNEQIFASKYQLILPSAAQLQEEINRQAELIREQLESKTNK